MTSAWSWCLQHSVGVFVWKPSASMVRAFFCIAIDTHICLIDEREATLLPASKPQLQCALQVDKKRQIQGYITASMVVQKGVSSSPGLSHGVWMSQESRSSMKYELSYRRGRVVRIIS